MHLSQQGYLLKVVERFRNRESKPMGTPHKSPITQVFSYEEAMREMKVTPYANGVGCIMYGIVCRRPC